MKKFELKTKKQGINERLNNEATLLCQAAEDMYWLELSKPEAQQDKQLIEECLLLIKDSTAIQNSNKQVKTSAKAIYGRAVAIACAVLLFIVASAGVAKAFGIDVWSIFVDKNKDGINITGTSNSGSVEVAKLFETVEDTNGHIIVDSLDEAQKRLKIKFTNLDLTKQGFMIDNIYILKDSNMIELAVDYISETDYVNYCVSLFCDSNAAFTSSLLGNYDSSFTVENKNIVFYVASGEVSTVAWIDNGYVYQISSSLGADPLMELIKAQYN